MPDTPTHQASEVVLVVWQGRGFPSLLTLGNHTNQTTLSVTLLTDKDLTASQKIAWIRPRGLWPRSFFFS